MKPQKNFVGTYNTYPDLTGGRKAEGGRRITESSGVRHTERPLVSIITVCRNAEATIEQTIRSVIEQDYEALEYIIVDGASTDSTVSIIRSFEAFIDYFVSEPDKGIYDAMNKGLELAQGDFILLLNSDDWYEPNAVSRLVSAVEYSGCDFVGSLARYVNQDGSSHVLPSMTYDKSVLLRMPLRHETMLIPAALYDQLGRYDLNYSIIADYEFTVRLYQAGATYYEVPAALLNFRTSGVSNTSLERLHLEHKNLLAQVFPFLSTDELERLSNHSQARPQDFIEAANNHLEQSDFVLAVRSMLRDFKRLWGGVWADVSPEDLFANHWCTYPKVSVVMPIYNAASFIDGALRAVLEQTLREIEIICVNDCSTDETPHIVGNWSEIDPRVRLIHNPRNLGPGGSRNVGVRAAKGKYVFFLDADDELPVTSLEALFNAAERTGSSIVRGAFRVDREIHGEKAQGIKFPAGAPDAVIEKTRLSDMPQLLSSTEGHWAGLYERDFIETVLYPENLRMGEDSLFLIRAISEASSITLIPDLVYIYKDNTQSAMNTYTFDKYMDEVSWRRRAWRLLDAMGQRDRGNFFLFEWWSPAFFARMEGDLDESQHREFYTALVKAFCLAGSSDASLCSNQELREIFRRNFVRYGLIEPPAPPEPPLQVAILSTSIQGGAGIASQRSMVRLRGAGVEAFTVCIFKDKSPPNVFGAPLVPEALTVMENEGVEGLWRFWIDRVGLNESSEPRSSSRELFSRPASIVQLDILGRDLAGIDIIHLHWVVGMLDFGQLDALVRDHPVVWTLHDMNPFTGGCHYSEGCEGYKDQCKNCPLLEPGATLAHEAWKAKKEAYSKIKHLYVVCPSQWLADCARESSLFRDREIHVIPNVFPTDQFVPTNKMVARLRLGLPLSKKLVAFGADSLDNKRKGGPILKESVERLVSMGEAGEVEGLFFGSSGLDVGIPCHNMGYVSDPARLSLIYAAADVFAFPSLEDNAPQTVVEAMLSGTPVVGFPVGNVPELVKHLDTGYVAAYGDAEDFAQGLSWALKDYHLPIMQLRGLRGHLHARRYHNADEVMGRCIALYKRIRKLKDQDISVNQDVDSSVLAVR